MAMAMATLFSLLFLLSIKISPSSSRVVPNGPAPLLHAPIQTKGKNYLYVCHPDRFNALGLDLSGIAYCNKNLSYYDRANDLIGRMTLAEKVQQISDSAHGVDRIGLPPYKWWSEILHGVSDVGQFSDGRATWFGEDVPGATQFPEVILSAASFNESLWKAIAQTVSTEARAMYNLGHSFLTFWSPVINVPRDPRWGRIMETPGEDPFVIGTYSVNFVRGLQDVEGTENYTDLNTRPIKVASCCKHFTAYDVENWYGSERFSFDARVSEQDMVESFNLPFEMCVKEGDSTSVMCSYNQVNGFPSCADPKLLTQTVRGEWNLHGYIVSDCYIYDYLHDHQHWLQASREDLVAKVINAGLDLECGFEHQKSAQGAVATGKLKEKEIDRALTNLYLVLMRVGFFDGMPQYNSLGKGDICTDQHQDLAADAARQGMVLLKNDGSTLPLSKDKQKSLAIGGTHVNSTTMMLGNYAGQGCRYVTPLDAFKAEAQTNAVVGCFLHCNRSDVREQMKNAAKGADATVLFMGIDTDWEGETLDRLNLTLPPGQVQFVQEVAQASKNPIVLVLMTAGGVDVSFARDDPKVGAILWAGYPGQEGGRAIADIVYGRYNPAGRLPITWYYDNYTLAIPMTSMQFRPNAELGYPGRTYKFFDGPTVYPFGHGLSYTQFNYTVTGQTTNLTLTMGKYQQCQPLAPNANPPSCPSVSVADLASCNATVDFEVDVANTGKVDGEHVVIAYVQPPPTADGAPIKQVIGFQRVFVAAGKSQPAKFSIDACQRLSFVDSTAYRIMAAGQHTIVVGDETTSASFPLQVSFAY